MRSQSYRFPQNAAFDFDQKLIQNYRSVACTTAIDPAYGQLGAIPDRQRGGLRKECVKENFVVGPLVRPRPCRQCQTATLMDFICLGGTLMIRRLMSPLTTAWR